MPPLNTSMALARVMDALPYTHTQDLTGMAPTTGGTDYHLWYQLPATLVTGGMIVGAQGAIVGSGFGGAPFAGTWVYTNPPDGLVGTPYLNASSSFTYSGGRVQIPLAATPQPYYFLVSVHHALAPTYDVTFSCYRAAPPQGIPIGSILINSDADVPGFPAVALAAGTADLLAFLPGVMHGETGDILPDGRMLLAGPAALYLYAADRTLLTTIPLLANVGSGNQVDTFYVTTVAAGQTSIRALDRTGTPGAVFGPLPAAASATAPLLVAVSRAETQAYLTNARSWAVGGGTVLAWDLGANVALPVFAPAVTGYDLVIANGTSPGGILVLADDSVVVGYFASNGNDSFVQRYASAGAVLTTYPRPTGYQLNRIAHDPTDDGLTFWVWWKGDTVATDGVGRFDRLRVSDGVVLETTLSREVRYGSMLQGDPTTTAQIFGHPFSCPFLLTRVATEAPPDGGGGGGGGGDTDAPPHVAPSYHLDARYIRRLRRAPHVAQEHQRVFYRRFELDLERGQGLATGQGSDPMVLLRISRDGGQTWGEEQRMAAGRLGEYTARVMARRLGQARDTVFEVVVSDPIAWSLVGAWLDLEPGTN